MTHNQTQMITRMELVDRAYKHKQNWTIFRQENHAQRWEFRWTEVKADQILQKTIQNETHKIFKTWKKMQEHMSGLRGSMRQSNMWMNRPHKWGRAGEWAEELTPK